MLSETGADHGTESVEVFRNAWSSVRTYPMTHPNGVTYEQTTFTPGTGMGVMVVPLTVHERTPMIGLVDTIRPGAGGHWSWEFPRGGSTDLSDAEARRILAHETGITTALVSPLGAFQPENGMVDCIVGSYLAAVAVDDAADADGHIDPATGASFSWYDLDEFTDLIRSGYITDGITLATWTLASTRLDDFDRAGRAGRA